MFIKLKLEMNEEKMYWIIGSKRGREDVNENDKNDFERERISVTKKIIWFPLLLLKIK